VHEVGTGLQLFVWQLRRRGEGRCLISKVRERKPIIYPLCTRNFAANVGGLLFEFGLRDCHLVRYWIAFVASNRASFASIHPSS
jgi:hypothetical protein